MGGQGYFCWTEDYRDRGERLWLSSVRSTVTGGTGLFFVGQRTNVTGGTGCD